MTLDLAQTDGDLYASDQSQVQTYLLVVKSGGHWFIHQEAIVVLINTLMYIEDKMDISIKEKSKLRLAGLLSTPQPRNTRG